MASVILSKIPLKLKPKQIEFFDLLGQERDLIVNLPVGYGKSILYYFIPEFFKVTKNIDGPIVIVISPLTIIQKDQMVKASHLHIKAARMDQEGHLEDESGSISLNEIKQGLYPVLLCHPEGLFGSVNGKALLKSEVFQARVVAVVVDECHIVEKWGKTFRTAFSQIKTLPAFFGGAPMIALSGTLTTGQLKTLPSALGLFDPILIQETPEKSNIFLQKFKKSSSSDVLDVYESIYMRECDNLKADPKSFPVTLMFMPLKYISHAAAYLKYLFRSFILADIPYSVIFSNQEKEVIDKTLAVLQEASPRIRLILTTSVSGMGFDPPCILRVIHVCPPRDLSQYLQEIGRAGRRGQSAEAILYYSNADIAMSLPELQQDIRDYCHSNECLRKALLAPFGFVPSNCYAVGCKCCSVCKSFCECEICSVLVPEVITDLNEEMSDVLVYEKIETSIVPMEQSIEE